MLQARLSCPMHAGYWRIWRQRFRRLLSRRRLNFPTRRTRVLLGVGMADIVNRPGHLFDLFHLQVWRVRLILIDGALGVAPNSRARSTAMSFGSLNADCRGLAAGVSSCRITPAVFRRMCRASGTICRAAVISMSLGCDVETAPSVAQSSARGGSGQRTTGRSPRQSPPTPASSSEHRPRLAARSIAAR